jgi:hypothetical protein
MGNVDILIAGGKERVRLMLERSLGVLILLGCAAPAFADATLFIGATTTPEARQVWGASGGISLIIVGFEVEYAHTREDPGVAPSLTTISGNGFLQTPVEFFNVQPYLTAGIGGYSETLGAHDNVGFGTNIGGGAKITLAGPLRVRADYRVFRQGSGALVPSAHRFYVGLNLKF